MATSFLGLPTVTAGTLIKASDWNSMVNKLDAAIKKIMVVEKLIASYSTSDMGSPQTLPSGWSYIRVVPTYIDFSYETLYDSTGRMSPNTAAATSSSLHPFKIVSTGTYTISHHSFYGGGGIKITLFNNALQVQRTSNGTSTQSLLSCVFEVYKYEAVSV